MASSSTTSSNWRYNVFPSFRGEDVRNSFLSHLLMELERKLITTFIDHGIDRSRPIGPELLLAIKESRIAIVIFSKNYASSTWCLNELVEIHKCFKDLDQMVIPIFYHVDPSEIRKQTGEFGERFKETCKDKTEDERERWIRVLTDVANLAGEDSKNWIGEGEAKMIEHIAKDVFNKLMIPSNDCSVVLGIEAHFQRLNSLLCLESEEVRKVGIWGPSGVGKSTIGRALFSQLSSLFHKHAFFVSYKSKKKWDDNKMKLCLDERLLSEILCQKDVKIRYPGVAKQRLMDKKILIIVDDVDDREVLNILMDQTSLVGSGSRIVVITQDKKILKSQEIDLIYEVKLPPYDLAMQMLCRSAFGRNSPPYGFEELAREVTLHSSNLPLGLSVLGSSLKGMDKEEWVEILPRLFNSLDGKIKNTLKVCYDRLDAEEQELFLCIACLPDGCEVDFLKNLLGDSAEIGLKILNDKSLIRRESTEFVGMHSLLQKLGKEINRADPIDNRRFLTEAEDICDVLTDITGTKNTIAMDLNMSEINKPLVINENSFQRMSNLKLLNFYQPWWSRKTGKSRLDLPDRGLDHFPYKLRLLRWDEYPSKCMPFNFRAECLVELKMENSKLEKLWEGTQMTVPTFQEHSNSLYIQPAVNFGLVALNLDLFLGLAGASGEEERDEESNRSKKKMRMTILTLQKHFNSLTIQPAVNSELVAPNLELSLGLAGASGDEERDEESNRSKKKMQMTVLTLQKHFNSLTIQPAVNSEPVAPNLKLFLGLARASGEVSSGSKVPSTSRNFCGDGASSFDPCLGGESLHFEPLIIEQQNTGTSDEDPVEISLNPKLT